MFHRSSRRPPAIPPQDGAAAATSLAELARGRSARIVDVCAGGDPAMARRLFDLGFRPDATVQLVRRAPLADPVIFQVAGYELALRRAQARLIRVRPLA